MEESELSPFLAYSRADWTRTREVIPAAFLDAGVEGSGDELGHVSRVEIDEVYLPVSWLLYLHFGAARDLYRAVGSLLPGQEAEVPYVVGIAGSVAVGKSTAAQVLRALISRWPGNPSVELVSTDGFIYPNRVLEARGLMERKGFPESYDLPLLLKFLADVKSGVEEASAPIHSHLTYDILPDEAQVVRRPDVLIVEGLNMLEVGVPEPSEGRMVFVSDYCDFSLYVDAEEKHVEKWFLERFLRLREEAAGDSSAFMHQFAVLSLEEAMRMARRAWDEIDHPNLKDNIEPTRDRARLILEKDGDHSVRSVRLRRI